MYKKKFFAAFLITIMTTFCLYPNLIYSHDCLSCHNKNGVKVSVPATEPIKILVDGKIHTIKLEDAFKFHGHECPGMTTAFLAIRYGINLLFKDQAPNRDDLLIIARTPAGGVKDLIDLIMKGDNPNKKTWPPIGMKNDENRFTFNIARKSTSEIVEVKLKPTHFHADFIYLQKKQKDKTINKEEQEQLHSYIKKMIKEFPQKSNEELFGNPEPYKVIFWGAIDAGEMEINAKKMRQAQQNKIN